MKYKLKIIAIAVILAIFQTGCGKTVDFSSTGGESTNDSVVSSAVGISSEENSNEQEIEIVTNINKIDNTKWQYNEEDNVYWQVGISYCEKPADERYETLGIFVPGDYMIAADNGDGTFTCEINTEAVVGNYTAETAPIVIPVDTPGYSAMAAPTGYVNGVSDYTGAGFIYLNAGCRGRDAGAPAGVTDLKAAIRYIRYNEGIIAGSTDRIFTFGMSGGGAQSALVGATGDSDLYTPYLEEIGAVQGVSDAVAGSMCWCPITNLDYANEAYEWNMGVTRNNLDEETQQLSDSMAEAFAEYVNVLGLKDENGNVLVLTESEDGIYQSGSYYDYMIGVVEQSLNNFLEDTSFPYSAGSTGGRGGFGNGELPNLIDGEFGDFKNGEFPDGGKDGRFNKGDFGDANLNVDINDENKFYERDGINRADMSGGVSLSGTYETAQDYINALNADGEWIKYDSQTNTASITSLADFVKACKNASKSVGAFDDLNSSQGENTLFGYGDGNGAHFDPIMAEFLKDTEYGDAYAADLEKKDSLGNTVDYRLNMYNPMYYLNDYYEGYQSANVAQYWRIRTGITQSDTALNTEVNLALALENYGADVDFETVWGQGHVEAERTGSSTENFIDWVNECLK
ncbi:MAG: subtype A tannase [Oscillospiraceae bacterium]